VELPALEGLRRLYAGAWVGIVMEGRFFGRDSCGPVGGGEVALPGGLLAIAVCSFCDVRRDGLWCKVAGRVGGLKVDCLGDAACTASDGEGAVTRLG
jgi:hypothetical protein